MTTNTKNRTQDRKQRIVFPICLFNEDDTSIDVAIPREIHVVPTGEWNHPAYGSMKITPDNIAEFVEHFNQGVRKEIPITAGHEVMQELPAVGWFRELIDRGANGLFAVVEWTKEGERLLKERAFRYFSPEYFPVYEDPTTGRTYRNVLVGGALTNKPFFKELADVVVFSEPRIINQFSESMDINAILQKASEDRTEEEVSFLEDHKDEMTDEQRTQFEGDSGADDGDDAESGDDAEDGDASADGDGDDDGASQQNATEPTKGKVTLSEAEFTALSMKANAGHQAFQELDRMKVRERVSKLVFSESNKDGRLLPKQKDAVEKFLFSLDEKARDQFVNIINSLPKRELFSEHGDEGAVAPDSAAKEVETAVAEKIKASEGSLQYKDALLQVFQENPGLEQRYNEEVAG